MGREGSSYRTAGLLGRIWSLWHHQNKDGGAPILPVTKRSSRCWKWCHQPWVVPPTWCHTSQNTGMTSSDCTKHKGFLINTGGAVAAGTRWSSLRCCMFIFWLLYIYILFLFWVLYIYRWGAYDQLLVAQDGTTGSNLSCHSLFWSWSFHTEKPNDCQTSSI